MTMETREDNSMIDVSATKDGISLKSPTGQVVIPVDDVQSVLEAMATELIGLAIELAKSGEISHQDLHSFVGSAMLGRKQTP